MMHADIMRQTHEFRVATSVEHRTRLDAGVVYDQVENETPADHILLMSQSLNKGRFQDIFKPSVVLM